MIFFFLFSSITIIQNWGLNYLLTNTKLGTSKKKKKKNFQFIVFLFCSPSDVALIVKYIFAPHTDTPLESKKRKIVSTPTPAFLNYLTLKLPALVFLHYLETDAQHFIIDCQK